MEQAEESYESKRETEGLSKVLQLEWAGRIATEVLIASVLLGLLLYSWRLRSSRDQRMTAGAEEDE